MTEFQTSAEVLFEVDQRSKRAVREEIESISPVTVEVDTAASNPAARRASTTSTATPTNRTRTPRTTTRAGPASARSSSGESMTDTDTSDDGTVARLVEQFDPSAPADDIDADDLVEEYGTTARLHGVALGYQALNEAREAAADTAERDGPADTDRTLTGRLRRAWRALRGRRADPTPVTDGGDDAVATFAELRQLTDECHDVLEQRTDDLGDELHDRVDDTADVRGFQ